MKPGILLVVAVLSACTNAQCPTDHPIERPLSVNGQLLSVEIAATTAARACGLSMRDSLPSNRGMLFVYPDKQILLFWMKDTVIPLTIAFLDTDGRILELHDMDPRQPERIYRSRHPARYALEVNKGWFRLNGIGVGDRVRLLELPTYDGEG